MDFNPRSPCGERQSPQTVREGVITYFNPRSPCGERLAAVMIDGEATLFQSTLSLRRATGHQSWAQFRSTYFNPRSPCGERPQAATAPVGYIYRFQSTLSLRRATRTHGLATVR